MSQAEIGLSSSWPNLALVGCEAAQLFPAALDSDGGLGLKGSCGKTNDPGSWAGLGDSWLVPGPCDVSVWEVWLLWEVPLVFAPWDDDFFELPLVRLLLPGDARNL